VYSVKYYIRCSKKKSIIFIYIFIMKLNGKIMDFFLLYLIYSLNSVTFQSSNEQ